MYEVDRYHRVNVDGTRRAAEFAVGHGIPLLLVSSRAVYGEGRHECRDHRPTFGRPCCAAARPAPSREDDPHHPVSVLGETKSLAESVATRPVRRPGAADRRAAPGRHRARAVAAQPPRRGPRRVPRHAARTPTPGASTATATRPATSCTSTTSPPCSAHLVAAPPEPGHPLVLNAGTGVRTSLVELARLAADAAPVPSAGTVHGACVAPATSSTPAPTCAVSPRSGAPLPVHTTAQARRGLRARLLGPPRAPGERLGRRPRRARAARAHQVRVLAAPRPGTAPHGNPRPAGAAQVGQG